jgi:hypothetical protein
VAGLFRPADAVCVDLKTFHVEHRTVTTQDPKNHHAISLVMETKKKDRADDDRSEQNLTDVIVEDLLVGTGNVSVTIFFPVRNFCGQDRAGFRRYVLFDVHVLTPLVARQSFPCVCNFVFWGVPLFPGARVFITKVPPFYNCFFAIICRLFSTSRR